MFISKSISYSRVLHSFPTRRSSDLLWPAGRLRPLAAGDPGLALDVIDGMAHYIVEIAARLDGFIHQNARDRKSTRLNSSHGYISYAVFCLKKKSKVHDTWKNTDSYF